MDGQKVLYTGRLKSFKHNFCEADRVWKALFRLSEFVANYAVKYNIFELDEFCAWSDLEPILYTKFIATMK